MAMGVRKDNTIILIYHNQSSEFVLAIGVGDNTISIERVYCCNSSP